MKCLFIILVLVSPILAKPVSTSIERLEELKAKLRGLEKELSSYDVKDRLDNSLESKQERRELFPSTEGDSRLNEYLQTLGEQDRHVLEKMRSKLQLLKDALSAQTRMTDQGPGSPQETKRTFDDQLQTYLNDLTPDDAAKVNKYQSRLSLLRKSLINTAPSDPLDVVESGTDLERRATDDVLQTFLDRLSAEDHNTVAKLKSKLKYLLAAITTSTKPDPLDVESKVPSRRGYAQSPAILQKLSVGDRQVALDHSSKLGLLEQALNLPPGGNSKRELLESSDRELQEFMDSLPNEDTEMLQKHSSSLNQLRKAVHERRQNPEKLFGDYVKSSDDSKPGVSWGSQPSPDRELGLVEKRCPNGGCEVSRPSVKQLAQKIAAELRSTKGSNVTLSDILKRVKAARLNAEY